MIKRFIKLLCLLLPALILCSCAGNEPFFQTSSDPLSTGQTTGQTTGAAETPAPSTETAAESSLTTPAQPSESPSPSSETETTGQTTPDAFEYKTFRAEDLPLPSPLSAGSGVSVPAENCVNIFENRRTIDGKTIQLLNTALSLEKTALLAFEDLNAALGKEYPGYSLLLVSCRAEDAGDLRCGKDDAELFAHSTGYAVDCWYMTKGADGKNVSVQFYEGGTAEKNEFLFRTAAALGIVQERAYAEGHAFADLRHLVYVGVPHASYIYENRLTLSAYLDRLSSYTPEAPLLISAQGGSFAVYTYPFDEEEASIPLMRGCDCRVVRSGSVAVVTATLDEAPQPVTPTPSPVTSETPVSSQDENAPVVYVDAGHGFLSKSGVMDYGAGEGSFYYQISAEERGKGLYEADLTLQIALKVEALLLARGYRVIMSRRDYAYERLPISDRAVRARNAGADLLVSIHANAAANPDACGARVYFNDKESFSKRAESRAFAQKLCGCINELCPSATAAYPVDGQTLAMLNGTGPIPSVLVETCFMTNEGDARKALDEDWQNAMALAIVNGIASSFPL